MLAAALAAFTPVTCPVLMLAEKEADDAREIAAMEGLCQLAGRGEIAKISGWAHPYCWFLQPEEASEAIINFLGRVASARAWNGRFPTISLAVVADDLA